MFIAVTGATGFLGRYIVRHLTEQGHRCRCWHRPGSDLSGFGNAECNIEWVAGSLETTDDFPAFCRGTKEVHAADVARAVSILLNAETEKIKGQAFNCYDIYVAEKTVAALAKEISGSKAEVGGNNKGPKNQIDTGKIRALGMKFGGEALLRRTIEELVSAVKK